MRAHIDVSEIEAKTKIRAKYLRALENEEWGLLPGPTFVKSFLRTYAQALGLDGKALVEEYRLQPRAPERGGARADRLESAARRARRGSGGRRRRALARVHARRRRRRALVIVLLVVGLLRRAASGSKSTHRAEHRVALQPRHDDARQHAHGERRPRRRAQLDRRAVAASRGGGVRVPDRR